MNAAPAHGAYLRHPVPPPGPAGELHGNPAEDRPAPSPRQAVHRTTAPPPVPVLAVGDDAAWLPSARKGRSHAEVVADLFRTHTARHQAEARAQRRRDRLAGAGLALAFAAVLAVAYLAAHATAGPIRPHVASAEARR